MVAVSQRNPTMNDDGSGSVDSVSMCADMQVSERVGFDALPTKPPKEVAPEGYLYFIQCNGERGPVKIGYAKSVDQRLSNIRMSNPYPLALLGSLSIAHPKDVEEQLHMRFQRTHIRGEWFGWTPELGALADLATQCAHERMRARLDGEPDPILPAEFLVVDRYEVEAIDQTIADDVARFIKEMQLSERSVRLASSRRRSEALSYAPKREKQPARPAPAPDPNAFVWRGKTRTP